MCRHDGVGSGADGFPEGNEIGLFQVFETFMDHGEGKMGIHGGAPATGKVLGAGQNAGFPDALYIRPAEKHDLLRIF